MSRRRRKETCMAVYTCTTQEGTLSAEQRAVIAAEITRIHSTHTGEPASFVWVIFESVSADSIYSGGKPALNVLIVGIFREDRSKEVKAQVLNELGSMSKIGTGLADVQLWVSLTVIPVSHAMV